MPELFRPEGVFPAMVTPFDGSGKPNEAVLRRMVRWLIHKGVNGLFPLGSVGEGIHVETGDKIRVMEICLDETRGRLPVIPGVMESYASRTADLVKKAESLGCTAAVVGPPYYFHATQEQIERHYEDVLKEVPDFPVILYNIPLFSTPISYDVIKRLSRFPNVVAVKDSSGSMVDMIHFMDKIRAAGEDVVVLTGRDEMLLPALTIGAKGAMSASVGVVPEIMTEIYRRWRAGDLEAARELQFSHLSLLRAMFVPPLPLGFKAALELRGFAMGEPVQPISNAEQYELFKIKRRIAKILGILLKDDVLVDGDA